MNSYNEANPIISFRIKDYQKKKLDNISKKDARSKNGKNYRGNSLSQNQK